MLDLSHLPRSTEGNSQMWFGGTSSSPATTRQIRTFVKPRGITMMSFLVIGAGGSGAGGFASTGTSTRFGGGGGGSGGITSLIIAANLVPDVLYVSPGDGGYQPTFNAAGVAGSASWVSMISPTASAEFQLISANAGGGAGAGSGTASGTAGAAATIASTDKWATLGNYQATAGQVGATGAASVTWGAVGRCIVSGGAGGGNTTGNGGSVTGAGLMPTNTGGLANLTGGLPGETGRWFRQPMISCGGSGGGTPSTSTTAYGGRGGDGAFGSGGGGGGAAAAVLDNNNAGGRGGPGLIFVTWW